MNSNSQENAKNVFVVYGRTELAKRSMYEFLRAIGLNIVEWDQVVALTKKGSPFVGEILEVAFRVSKAVVVLLTGDDEARLKSEYYSAHEPEFEKVLTPQPRQNVLFEAGMAFGLQRKRTVLVELGSTRPFSDVLGRYSIRLDNTSIKRNELAQRLKAIGCEVHLEGSDWLFAGNFAF